MRSCLLRHNRLLLSIRRNAPAKGIAFSMTQESPTAAAASASAPASAAAVAPPPPPKQKSKKPQPPPPTPTIIHRPPLDPVLLPVPGEPLCRAALRVLNAPTADMKARLGAEAARMWREGQLELPSAENAALDPPAPERPARDDDSVTIVPPQKVKRLKAGGELVLFKKKGSLSLSLSRLLVEVKKEKDSLSLSVLSLPSLTRTYLQNQGPSPRGSRSCTRCATSRAGRSTW